MKTEIPDGLTKLIVLAGEGEEKPRSRRAVKVYRAYGRLPIVVSGSHSGLHGLNLPDREEPLAFHIKRYLLLCGVSEDDLTIEGRARDTHEYFFNSRQKELIVPGDDLVGIVTDEQHIQRSLWTAHKFFGDSVSFIGIPSETEYGRGFAFQEWLLMAALKSDLREIRDGDMEELIRYMNHVHPYSSCECHRGETNFKPAFSWYGLIANLAKQSKLKLREK
jgi:uncharacterized SAM-binding protein YcdF (DUF218 family)